ncbi:MAG: YdeI/OmpD-associated family protein [Cyanobacteria bacterium P01_D01_bin.36]
MDDFPFIFDSPIVPHSFGTYNYAVVFLPEEMSEDLPFQQYPNLRIEAEVGSSPFSGAWRPTGGRWYLLLSKKFLKKSGFDIGDWVTVRFRIADQNAVDMPESLRLALEQDDHARAIWENLTPGKRRSFAYRVSSAKTAPTQARRVTEVLEKLIFEAEQI